MLVFFTVIHFLSCLTPPSPSTSISISSVFLILCSRQALLELVFGVKVVITGDGFVPGERSVIVMNHRTRLDWMFLWCCLLRYSYLRLEKICLKDTLKAVPGFGGYDCWVLVPSWRVEVVAGLVGIVVSENSFIALVFANNECAFVQLVHNIEH